MSLRISYIKVQSRPANKLKSLGTNYLEGRFFLLFLLIAWKGIEFH